MERLILLGARVFDGTGRAPQGNLAVVVENGRIADILPGSALGGEIDGRKIDLAAASSCPV